MALFSVFGRDPIDQNTGKGALLVPDDWLDNESLMGSDRAKNSLIEGSLGSAKLRENNKAAEKAKADRKSRMNEWLGWETRK